MKLIEVFDDPIIEVSSFKDKLKHAAIAAAMGGLASISPFSSSSTVPDSAPKMVQTQDKAGSTQPKPHNVIYGSDADNNKSAGVQFPAKLKGLSKLQPEARVTEFEQQFLPYINASNARILSRRKKLLDIVHKMSAHEPVSSSDKAWISDMTNEYNSSNIKDLMTRIDIVPPSLALAQAAIESGWATARIAQKGNVFYGEKVSADYDTPKKAIGDRKGGVYRQYATPLQSVEAYMYNLNSGADYDEFRKERALQRKEGKKPNGQLLSFTLDKYSSRGYAYSKQIDELIHDHKWYKLDDGGGEQ
jgi:Bax protein